MGPQEVVLQVYDPYIEMGAHALDARDGVVRVRVLGGQVDTSSVTMPGQPLLVVYEAVDASGNVARSHRRVVVRDDCTQRNEHRCACVYVWAVSGKRAHTRLLGCTAR
ncbi:hypothetical protein PLESTM_000417400 [Pleodorina starrii]|nr:hypothetical protein PLESTM_000417400 [Pleodorina starrii]